MKVALVGVGQAGGKLTQRLVEFDYHNEFDAVRAALAVNSAKADLQSLDIDTVLVGEEHVKGQGVGGDNELGARVMETDAEAVLDDLHSRVTADVEAIVVVAALGGGTGSGGAPVLVRELKRVYEELPVYGLGILPGQNEARIYQTNAGRSLKTLLREADATMLVDNDAWHESGESIAAAYEEINEAIASRIGLFLAAGEGDGEYAPESVVDASEILNTLREGGVAALGYASAVAAEDAAENINTVTSLTQQALHSGTSLPDADEAQAALLVVAGRPDAIPRKGVEEARQVVEEQTGSIQVRGGDFPIESDRLATLVLLSGVEGSGRIDDFLDRAREAQREMERRREQSAEEQFQSEELDDLF